MPLEAERAYKASAQALIEDSINPEGGLVFIKQVVDYICSQRLSFCSITLVRVLLECIETFKLLSALDDEIHVR